MFLKNNLPIENIHWGVKDKVSKCKELGIDLMIEDNPNQCKLLKENNIKTIYFRDKDNEKIHENEYLKEVSNIGEICRYTFNLVGFKNSQEIYKNILKRK